MSADIPVDASAPVLPMVGHLGGFPAGELEAKVAKVDFEEFVRVYRSKLIFFLRSRGANFHDAEDLTNATLIEAFRKWDSVKSPWSFAYTVALRKYRDTWNTARSESQDETELERRPADVPLTVDAVELTEQEQRILAAFAELPPRQRDVAALRYDGYSNEEIARMLGVDSSAVRHNVLRAKSRLRTLLGFTQEDAG